MKALFFWVLFIHSVAFAQVSPLSDTYRVARGDSSFYQLETNIEQVNALVEFLADETFNYNVFLDQQMDIGRKTLSDFLSDHIYVQDDGTIRRSGSYEELKDRFVQDYLFAESTRESFEAIVDWAQFPDVVAQQESDQQELYWRSCKVIKELKLISENYLAQYYLYGTDKEQKARSFQEGLADRWQAIVEDSLSFTVMYNALQQPENAHLRTLRLLVGEFRTEKLNKSLAERYNTFIAEYPERAIHQLLHASEEYVDALNLRSKLSSEMLQTVRMYWEHLYPNATIEADSIEGFLKRSYKELRVLQEGYLDLCRNFSIVEVDENGLSVLLGDHVKQLADTIVERMDDDWWMLYDTLNRSMKSLPMAEQLLETPFRSFQYYRNMIGELYKRQPQLATDIYEYVGLDTTRFEGVTFDLEALKRKLKEMRSSTEFVTRILDHSVQAFVNPLLADIGCVVQNIERRGDRMFLSFVPLFVPGENAWVTLTDTTPIVIDIPVPDNWESGLSDCSEGLLEALKQREVRIETAHVLRHIFQDGVSDYLIPERILFQEGDHLMMYFSEGAPVSCVVFSETPSEECYHLPYDALRSESLFRSTLHSVFKKEFIARYEERLHQELTRMIEDVGLMAQLDSIHIWLDENHVRLTQNGATIRIPLVRILPQFETGAIICSIGNNGEISTRMEDVEVTNALAKLLNDFPFLNVLEVENNTCHIVLDYEGSQQVVGTYNPQNGHLEITSGKPMLLTLAAGYELFASTIRYTNSRLFLDSVEVTVHGEKIHLSTIELQWKDGALRCVIPKEVLEMAQGEVISKIRSRVEGELSDLILSNEGVIALMDGAAQQLIAFESFIEGVREEVELTREELETLVRSTLSEYAGINNVRLHWDVSPRYATFDAVQTIGGHTISVDSLRVVFSDATHYALDFSRARLGNSARQELIRYIKSSLPQSEYLSFGDIHLQPGLKYIGGEIDLLLTINELGISHVFQTDISIGKSGIRIDLKEGNFWQVTGKQVVAQIDRTLRNKTYGNVTLNGVDYQRSGSADYLKVRASVYVYEDLNAPANLWIPLDNNGAYRLEVDDFMGGIREYLMVALQGEFSFSNEFFELKISALQPIDREGSTWSPSTGKFPCAIEGSASLNIAAVSIPLPNFVLNERGLTFTSMQRIAVECPTPIYFPPLLKFTHVGLDLDLEAKTLNFRGDASYIAEGSENLAKMHGDHVLDIARFETVTIENDLILLGFLPVMNSQKVLDLSTMRYSETLDIGGALSDIISVEASGIIGLKELDAQMQGDLELFQEKLADAAIFMDLKNGVLRAETKLSFLGSDWVKARAQTEEGLSHPELQAKVNFEVATISVASSELSVSEQEAYIEFEAIGIDFAIGASGLDNLEDEVKKTLERLLDLNIGDLEELFKQLLSGNLRVNPFSDFGGGKGFGTSSGKGGAKGGDGKRGGGEQRGERGGNHGGSATHHKGRYTGTGPVVVGNTPIGGIRNSEWIGEGKTSTGNVGLIPNEEGTSIRVEAVGNNRYRLSTPQDVTVAYIIKSYQGQTFVWENNTLNTKIVNTFGNAVVFYLNGKFYCFPERSLKSYEELKPRIIPYSVIEFDSDEQIQSAAAQITTGDNMLRFHLLSTLINNQYNSQTKIYFYPWKGYAVDIENDREFMLYYHKDGALLHKQVNVENVNPQQVRTLLEKRMQ